MIPAPHARTFLVLFPVYTAGLALIGSEFRRAGYLPSEPAAALDTIRQPSTEALPTVAKAAVRAVIPGYLSSWGLPPVQGNITIGDSGLVFHSARGAASTQASSISLAYVDQDQDKKHYLFRVDAGVFETDAPGALLEVISDPAWLRTQGRAGWRSSRLLVDAGDSLAQLGATRGIGTSPYADSLFTLFGRPRAPLGLIGPRGRSAGRLGEYIAARDSLALDPARMIDGAQLRHALAHELGHRWQARAAGQLAMLWQGVPSIRDPKRYGYGEQSEHQAEAIAFAINFLQTTAVNVEPPSTSLMLLDHYDLLVPGTRTMVRYLALQPLYRQHPLRALLTTGLITHARGR